MLNLIRRELAEIEVEDKDNRQFPRWEQFLFKRVKRERFTDIPTALEYYNKLTDYQVGVCYWEYASWACFNVFMRASKKQMAKSISMLDYVKEELRAIDVFLNTGNNKIMANSIRCIDLIPKIGQYSSLMFGDNNHKDMVSHDFYMSLLSGRWEDFINPDELISYKKAFEKNAEDLYEGLRNNEAFMDVIVNQDYKSKPPPDIDVTDAMSGFIENHPLYKDKFNQQWNMAVTIQGALWYRKYLEEIDYSELESLYWYNPKDNNLDFFEKQLERQNDGYLLMLDMRKAYLAEFETEPSWSQLMDYIGKNEWSKGDIDVIYEGSKVKSIDVEGLGKPLTRESFRHRFNRYFKKPD